MTGSYNSEIYQLLNKEYNLSQSRDEFLHFENPYQVLIATILSAQTTDKCVNKVTKILFTRYPDPLSLSNASITDIEEIIHSTGFFHTKAKNIQLTARELISRFEGKVPDDIEALQTLPGVGRKTANIVMHHGFNQTVGIAVDTHVKRVSIRLGLSDNTDPDKIEEDLLQIIPKKEWGKINSLFILHGRKKCTARRPKCSQCTLHSLCPYFLKIETGNE